MKRLCVSCLGMVAVCYSQASLFAVAIGRPTTFDIRITQGSTEIVNATGVTVSPSDPLDGYNYMKIGTSGGGAGDICVSVWMQDPTAAEGTMSFYVRATAPGDPLNPGQPLFNTSGSGQISATISNLQFKVGSSISDVNVAQFSAPVGDAFSSIYMMDSGGWYYGLLGIQPVWIGSKVTQQVPYSAFRDGDPTYDFVNGSGTLIDVAWNNMYSPVDAVYTLYQSDAPYATQTDASHGAVFEMGLNAYTWAVPEPGTLGLLITGGAGILKRRFRR